MADARPSRPPWFQFSLRTMFIGVTFIAMACGYLHWQASIVRHRQFVIDDFERKPVLFSPWPSWPNAWPPVTHPIAFMRRALGDHEVQWIGVDAEVSAADFE